MNTDITNPHTQAPYIERATRRGPTRSPPRNPLLRGSSLARYNTIAP